VVERNTMTYSHNCAYVGQHCEGTYRVHEKNGTLWYRNSSSNTGDAGTELLVPADEVSSILLADGYYRTVTTVNGMLPGPTIDVEEGDTVVVNVYNALANEATTMHWHGMYQHGTPWMDGVSMVTQCAILPGEAFTYRFVAGASGSADRYHARQAVQTRRRTARQSTA
jgi:FtsP/CotA-like multicopper oxidase with cupredoxin domain